MKPVDCPKCGVKNRVPASAAGVPHCAACHAALPWLAPATDADFAQVGASEKVAVLVDLWAPWCGPCRMVAPILEKLSVERAGRLKVVKVNVDENPGLSARFGAQSIPTLVLLKGGREASRQIGALPIERMRTWLDGADV